MSPCGCTAVSEHNLHFNYVHVKDGSRIGYEKICKAEGDPVPDNVIARPSTGRARSTSSWPTRISTPRPPARGAKPSKYVIRYKRNLGCLRVRERLISLEKMYFADEMRPVDPLRAEQSSEADQARARHGQGAD